MIQIEPDKLLSRIIDHMSGKLIRFTILQYNREDFVQFQLNSALRDNCFVDRSDTIAHIYSSENQIILANLKGELEKARANLAMARSGEKAALQEEAQQALKIAKIELDAYEPQYQRKKELYERKLIGLEEWEIAKSSYKVYQSNINKEKARLHALQSGEKREIIRYFEIDIYQIKRRIKLIEEKLALESIQSPIRGILSYTKGDSIICQVNKMDSLLLKMPVPAEEIKYISPEQIVDFYIYESGQNYTASIIKMARHSQIINGRSMYMITALIENPEDIIVPGMSGYGKIHAEKVTLLTQLIRALNRYLGLVYL